MAARRCFKCRCNYPGDRGAGVTCPSCGTTLQYTSIGQPDTDWPPEIPKVLPDLTAEQRAEVDAEWARVAAEKARRGRSWSVADIIGEGGLKA